jgi:hypothetical protein
MPQQNAEPDQFFQPQKKKNLPNIFWVALGFIALAVLAWNICFSHC